MTEAVAACVAERTPQPLPARRASCRQPERSRVLDSDHLRSRLQR